MAKLTELALRRIMADIISGTFPPRTRLGQASLAERYRMSRKPIREALSVLAGLGWLVRLSDDKKWSVAELRRDVAGTATSCPACGSVEYRLLSDDDGQVLWCQRCFRVCPVVPPPAGEPQ